MQQPTEALSSIIINDSSFYTIMTIILVPSQHLVTLTAVSEHLIMKLMLGTQFDYLLTEV